MDSSGGRPLGVSDSARRAKRSSTKDFASQDLGLRCGFLRRLLCRTFRQESRSQAPRGLPVVERRPAGAADRGRRWIGGSCGLTKTCTGRNGARAASSLTLSGGVKTVASARVM